MLRHVDPRSALVAARPQLAARCAKVDAERAAAVAQCLQALTPRETYILRERFGLEDGAGRTLEEIGQELQISRERVRQIEARALEKLRRLFGQRPQHALLEN